MKTLPLSLQSLTFEKLQGRELRELLHVAHHTRAYILKNGAFQKNVESFHLHVTNPILENGSLKAGTLGISIADNDRFYQSFTTFSKANGSLIAQKNSKIFEKICNIRRLLVQLDEYDKYPTNPGIDVEKFFPKTNAVQTMQIQYEKATFATEIFKRFNHISADELIVFNEKETANIFLFFEPKWSFADSYQLSNYSMPFLVENFEKIGHASSVLLMYSGDLERFEEAVAYSLQNSIPRLLSRLLYRGRNEFYLGKIGALFEENDFVLIDEEYDEPDSTLLYGRVDGQPTHRIHYESINLIVEALIDNE